LAMAAPATAPPAAADDGALLLSCAREVGTPGRLPQRVSAQVRPPRRLLRLFWSTSVYSFALTCHWKRHRRGWSQPSVSPCDLQTTSILEQSLDSQAQDGARSWIVSPVNGTLIGGRVNRAGSERTVSMGRSPTSGDVFDPFGRGDSNGPLARSGRDADENHGDDSGAREHPPALHASWGFRCCWTGRSCWRCR